MSSGVLEANRGTSVWCIHCISRIDLCWQGTESLKYYANGDVKEKGIDVLVALELVKVAAAISGPYTHDTVILAAHDTDLEPALSLATQLADGRVETAGWHGAKQLRIPERRLWHTVLDEQDFHASRDSKNYA